MANAPGLAADVDGFITPAYLVLPNINGMEQTFCAIHDQCGGCGRVACVVTLAGPYDRTAIERALRLVTEQCPRAGVQLHRQPSGLFEFRIPAAPRFPVIEFQSVADRDAGYQLAVDLGRANGNSAEPVLRWVVLTSEAEDGFQIVGIAHHGAFDAASLLVLVRRFLEVCGSTTVPEWDWSEAELPQPSRGKFFRVLGLILRHAVTHYRLRNRHCRGLPREFADEGACVVQRWNPTETDALLNACRAAQTTVTAALGVAGATAVHDVYPELAPVVDVVIPTDTRRYLPAAAAERSVRMGVCGIVFVVDFRSAGDVGDRSRGISQTLHRFVESEGPLRLVHLATRMVRKQVKLLESPPVCVSANSLGRISFPVSPSGVRVVECGWFANGGPHMPAYSQTAATIDGRLAVTSYSTWISAERVRRLAQRTDEILRRFAGLPMTKAMPALETQPFEVTAVR